MGVTGGGFAGLLFVFDTKKSFEVVFWFFLKNEVFREKMTETNKPKEDRSFGMFKTIHCSSTDFGTVFLLP